MADVQGKLKIPFDFELFKQNHFSSALTVLDVLSSKPNAGKELRIHWFLVFGYWMLLINYSVKFPVICPIICL